MNSIGRVCCAILVAGLVGFHPQDLRAEGFTGADFAGWESGSQDSYIQTSMTMAGVVLTQTHPDAASCINDWYFAGASLAPRNDEIRETISQHESAHPAGVIMAIVLRECGPLN
ncbi:MAG: hypothetical protein AAF583_13990 [Pseudomonadota bacterium]